MKSRKIQIGRKSLIKFSLIFLILSLILFFLFRFISIKAEAGISVIASDTVIRGNLWSKKVVVSSDSEDHVYNISVSTNIPEDLTSIELYRYISSDMKIRTTEDSDYNFQAIDGDNNGKNDTVTWIVPELSEVSFSVEGTLIQSVATTTIDSLFGNGIFSQTQDQSGYTHIEKIGNIFHIWNDLNHYYINDTGIQITNHYQEYWTHNVWCLWIKTDSRWVRRCSDGLSWNWKNSTGLGWAELNGTASYSEGPYSAIFRVRYYLADGYNRINVSLGINNTGQDIQDMYFGWIVKDIRIGGDEENDWISLRTIYSDPEEWDLSNSTLTLGYNQSELLERHYKLRDVTVGAVDFWWDYHGWKDSVKHNMSYRLNVIHGIIPDQYNAPVLLRIHAGNLNSGQIVYTNFWWVDAPLMCTYYPNCEGCAGGDSEEGTCAWCTNPGTCMTLFFCPIACSGACISNPILCPSDEKAPTYSNEQTNSTEAGTACNFTLDWNDDIVLNPNGQYIFSTNNSGTWVNASAVNFSSTPETAWNVTVLNSTVGTLVQWKFYASDNVGNWNVSETYNLTTAALGWLNATLITPTPNQQTNWTRYNEYWINASVNCEGDAGDTCENVDGMARYTMTKCSSTCDWITYGGNDNRTGESTSEAPRTNETLWKANVTGVSDESAGPSVVNGIVYMGSIKYEKIFALNASTGEEIWNFSIGKTHAVPVFANGIVYIVTGYGGTESATENKTYAFNASTGESIWNYTMHTYYSSGLAYANGRIFVNNVSTAFALNASAESMTESERELWTYNKPDMDSNDNLQSVSTAVGDIVIFCYYDNDPNNATIVALNQTNGEMVWNNTILKSIWDSSPAIHDDVMFISEDQNQNASVAAVNITNGEIIWMNNGTEFNATNGFSTIVSSPAVANGRVFIGVNIYLETIKYLIALNETDGSNIWNKSISGTWGSKYLVYTHPAVADGIVFFGSYGCLYALNETTGEDIWSYKISSKQIWHPAVVNGALYVSADDWYLYAFRSMNPIPNNTGDTPFFISGPNPNSCGYMNQSQSCQLNWTVNATGNVNSTYLIDVNFISNETQVLSSDTDDAYVKITFGVEDFVEITLSQALLDGIMFDTVTPNTVGNPARNNSHPETRYNVTVGSSSTQNLDFYVKLNESFETGIYINESSSITSAFSAFITNTTVGDNWSILGNSTFNCTDMVIGNNCWMRLYFDAVNVPSGYKQRNYIICGVITGSNPSICG